MQLRAQALNLFHILDKLFRIKGNLRQIDQMRGPGAHRPRKSSGGSQPSGMAAMISTMVTESVSYT